MSTKFEDRLAELLCKLSCEDKKTETVIDLNKFYQERIETIRTRLWTALTWLAAVQGAALVLAIDRGKIRTEAGPTLTLEQPVLLVILAILGIVLAIYMIKVINNGIEHITSNQALSNFVVGLGQPKPLSKESLFAMKPLAYLAFCAQVGLAILGAFAIADWLGLDIPWLRLSPAVGAPTSSAIVPESSGSAYA